MTIAFEIIHIFENRISLYTANPALFLKKQNKQTNQQFDSHMINIGRMSRGLISHSIFVSVLFQI